MAIKIIQKGVGRIPPDAFICPQCGHICKAYTLMGKMRRDIEDLRCVRIPYDAANIEVGTFPTMQCVDCGTIWQWTPEIDYCKVDIGSMMYYEENKPMINSVMKKREKDISLNEKLYKKYINGPVPWYLKPVIWFCVKTRQWRYEVLTELCRESKKEREQGNVQDKS